MFEHLLPRGFIEKFQVEMGRRGIGDVVPYSKGTTSLVFLGKFGSKRVVIKLQRPDSPRENFEKEAEIIELVSPFGITPPILFRGSFGGLKYIVREFAEGEPILYAELEKKHIFEIALKTALLDRLGIDHGQIQGGKHIIVGEGVYLIDFEKAGIRKPRNLTSAMAMIFLGDNIIAKRVREKFSLDREFLRNLREELGNYKRTGRVSGILDLFSGL